VGFPQSSDPQRPVAALYSEAVTLRREERWTDAVQRFDAVLDRLPNPSEDQRDLALGALYLKAVCLHDLGQMRETIAACDRLDARYGADSDPKVAGFVADGLWLKNRALADLGDTDQARTVLRQIIDRYATEPRARNQVARAMYNEGIYLRDTGHGEDAIALWDDLFSRLGADPPSSDAMIPIRGQLAKSQYLASRDRLDQALWTCEQMLRECTRRGLPDTSIAEVKRTQQRCMSAARRSRRPLRRLRDLLTRRH
jgi:tetratricopeptide (TPR) repeat protein